MRLARRTFSSGLVLLGGAVFAAEGEKQPVLTETQLAAGRDLVAAAPSVDLHTHAGRFFIEGGSRATLLGQRLGPPFAGAALAGARAARIGCVCLNAVADYRVLGATKLGLAAERRFGPGEADADYRRQLGLLASATRAGGLTLARNGADVRRAWAAGKTAAVFGIEGGDFLEGRPDRLRHAHAAGVRIVTIIHYRSNAIGDPQTAPVLHHGLTQFGHDVIRRMNRLGMVMDLAHASRTATVQAVAASTRPAIISHANLRLPGLDHPRLIDIDHARIVTQAGGLIGAVPGGAGVDSLDAFATMVLRMVDALGVDHVAVGTDMDFGFASVVPDYTRWATIPAVLLARGMGADEVGRIIGGNALRLLDGL